MRSLAPLRRPFHFGDFRERVLAQIVVIEADEPLLGGAEDHRIVAAPAVRIAVRQFALADQHAALLQQFDDDRIRLEDGLAFVFGQAFDEAAFVVLRRVGFEAIFLAGAKVVGAMAGRGVNDAAALVERDVIGEHAGHAHIEKRMLEFERLRILFPSTSREIPRTSNFELLRQRVSRALFASRSLPADVSATTYSNSG